MLQTLIERAGFKELLESVQQPDGASAKDPLAKLPQEIQHFDLESFHDRPVQAELMELLLLEKDGAGFTTNVLIHGMGGTGKTVTAVAVLQEKAIRRFFSNVSSKAPTDRVCLSSVFSCILGQKSWCAKEQNHSHAQTCSNPAGVWVKQEQEIARQKMKNH